MSQIRLRQVARLERLALLHVKTKSEYRAEMDEVLRSEAFVSVANLSLLILYGNPKIEEPLSNAWQRCVESKAWKECLEKHPDIGEYRGYREYITPFDDLGAMYIAKYCRKYFIPDLPGADETAKLNAIFKMAPPWLLWFTHGDVFGRLIGLELPDLSSVKRFARGELIFSYLPKGPFECHRAPRGVEDEFYISRRKPIELPDNLTPRERKRAIRLYGNGE
jgi:hypothetical protein